MHPGAPGAQAAQLGRLPRSRELALGTSFFPFSTARYVDEVDKLAEQSGGGGGGGGGGRGVNTHAVQASLLKLMEDAEVPIGATAGRGGGGAPGAPGAPWTYSGPGAPAAAAAAAAARFGGGGGGAGAAAPTLLRTRHVLFIFSGAFARLERELFERDLQRRAAAKAAAKAAGEAPPEEADAAATEGGLLGSATTADFVRGGLEPEFVGRIPVRAGGQRRRRGGGG